MGDAMESMCCVTEMCTHILDSTFQAVQALVLPLENKSIQVESLR
jgi:hypothetical protein